MKRVVIDTNVLVSGLLFGGPPGKLVTQWKSGKIQPLCSKEMVEEYLRVLAYPKFQLTESDIDFLSTHEILPFFHILKVKPGKPFVVADPSDDKFIWCAMQGNAEVIVSGDIHLLKLSSSPIPVITAAAFIQDR